MLQLMFRQECHLCEDMLYELQPLLRDYPAVGLELLDIDLHDDLLARFDDKVPVLVHQQQVLCEYFLDEDRVRHYLDGQQLDGQSGPP